MSSSAMRGAVLVAVAALLGFLVLRGAADNAQFPVATGPVAQASPSAVVEVTPDDSVAVPQPTAVAEIENARPNSEVSVMVVNGTEVTGQARRLTLDLLNQGFSSRDPRNSEDPQTASTIFYRTGFAAEATVVRNTLGGTTPIAPMPVPDPFLGSNIDLAPVDVLVVIGNDALSTS